MTTVRLLAVAYLGVAACALAGDVPLLLVPCCLLALLAIGELWLRALTAEAVAPVTRIGVATAAGIVSLPLVAVVLHWSGGLIRVLPLAGGLAALATGLGAVALVRERFARPAPDARLAGTVAVIGLAGGLAALIGGTAVYAYVNLPHPPQPGYTSVALNGWAAGIDRPVAFPARGLRVPIRVSSSGEPAVTAPLTVLVGRRPIGPARPVLIDADTTRSVEVHIPAPPDGCLHRIEIRLGAMSTVFYGRGPAPC